MNNIQTRLIFILSIFFLAASLHSCDNSTIVIPDGCTEITESTIKNHEKLESVVIPKSVTSIGGRAFYGCNKLRTVEIPESVTSIGNHAFSYCRNLESIVIPERVTSIGVSAFEACEDLESVEIPESVTSIGDMAFSGASLSRLVFRSSNPPRIGNHIVGHPPVITKILVPRNAVRKYQTASERWKELSSQIVGY